MDRFSLAHLRVRTLEILAVVAMLIVGTLAVRSKFTHRAPDDDDSPAAMEAEGSPPDDDDADDEEETTHEQKPDGVSAAQPRNSNDDIRAGSRPPNVLLI